MSLKHRQQIGMSAVRDLDHVPRGVWYQAAERCGVEGERFGAGLEGCHEGRSSMLKSERT
jgi:hypothetical protein